MTERRMKSDQVRTNWRDVLDFVRSGGTVVIEHYNRPVARLAPLETPMNTITAYASNSEAVYLGRGGQVWDLGPVTVDMYGKFGEDAQAWVDGDWEPNEADGQTRTELAGLTPIAEWTTSGVRELDGCDGASALYVTGGTSARETAMTSNEQRLTQEVADTVPDHVDDYDVPGIVEEIGTVYGYDTAVGDIPSEEYWKVVERHDKTA